MSKEDCETGLLDLVPAGLRNSATYNSGQMGKVTSFSFTNF